MTQTIPKTLITRAFALSMPLLSMAALAGTNPDILLNIGEPQPGAHYAGVSNLRGWAVAPLPLSHIEVYFDGEYLYNIPLGGYREDVARAYPDYPDALHSGFAMAFNYSDFSHGEHLLTLRAIDENGNHAEQNVDFVVERFANSYVTQGVRIDANTSFTIDHDNGIGIQHLTVDDRPYDLVLRWRTATQNFAIERITP